MKDEIVDLCVGRKLNPMQQVDLDKIKVDLLRTFPARSGERIDIVNLLARVASPDNYNSVRSLSFEQGFRAELNSSTPSITRQRDICFDLISRDGKEFFEAEIKRQSADSFLMTINRDGNTYLLEALKVATDPSQKNKESKLLLDKIRTILDRYESCEPYGERAKALKMLWALCQNKKAQTPLHFASRFSFSGDAEKNELFIFNKIHSNSNHAVSKDVNGKTPLMEYLQSRSEAAPFSHKVTDALLSRPVSLDADDNGRYSIALCC